MEVVRDHRELEPEGLGLLRVLDENARRMLLRRERVAELGHGSLLPRQLPGETASADHALGVSPGPLAGFRLEESWSDKGGNLAGGDIYRHPRPFMPNEVITVTLTTPFNTRMQSNSYNFIHANGNVKPKLVPKIEVPKTE